MSLYNLATKVFDGVMIDESRLPNIQSLVKKKWGVAKEADYKKYSTWPREGNYVKFWLLNDGSLIHVPFAHKDFGYKKGERKYREGRLGELALEYTDSDIYDKYRMLDSGAVVVSVSNKEINIENKKKLTDKQINTICNLYDRYGFRRIIWFKKAISIPSLHPKEQLEWLLGASKREMELITANEVKINESTTMSNISYLPTQLGAVKAMLTTLAEEKPDWDLEILDDLDPRQFIIKNKVKFLVPKKHWDGFLKIFGNKINGKLLKLGNMKESLEERRLFEANEADMKKLRSKLKTELYSLFHNKEFIKLQEMAWNWYSVFGVVQYTTSSGESIAVSNEKMKRDIQRIYGRLLREYGEDRGNLEMLIAALSNKSELNTFDVFRDFDYIFGTRMNSLYEGYHLGFEYLIDFMYNPSQTIYVADKELLDAIEEDITSGIKIVYSTIWPVGGLFKRGTFQRIKNVIDDLVIKKEK